MPARKILTPAARLQRQKEQLLNERAKVKRKLTERAKQALIERGLKK
jgi:hypothetical protein